MSNVENLKTAAKAPPPVTPPDIHARMVAVMRDLGAIGKDKKNEAQGFKYRGIDDVYNAINPILAKHGVFMTAVILSKTREERVSIKEYNGNKKESVLAFTCLRMNHRFVAEDGSFVETQAEGEGMDSGDKSSNKAMAVAHKYALLQAFCIPTQDLDDPDAHVHEVAAKPTQAQVIHQGMSKTDDDVAEGVKNWCDKEKHFLNNCVTVADVSQWQELRANELDRLKRKAVAAWSDLIKYAEARIEAINKQGRK